MIGYLIGAVIIIFYILMNQNHKIDALEWEIKSLRSALGDVSSEFYAQEKKRNNWKWEQEMKGV